MSAYVTTDATSDFVSRNRGCDEFSRIPMFAIDDRRPPQ
jgi:hypothetical protein